MGALIQHAKFIVAIPVASLLAIAAAQATTLDYNVTVIGYNDTEHTRDDGYQYNSTEAVNTAGQAAGESLRFAGGHEEVGRTAWFYDGATSQQVGLLGGEHINTTYGAASNYIWTMSAGGYVVGTTDRYASGNVLNGNSTWLFDGTDTYQIGLTDSEHTAANGSRTSVLGASNLNVSRDAVNDAGQAYGNAYRYAPTGVYAGQSSWFYNGTSTQRIGLIDADHTRSTDGYQDSQAIAMSQTGYVIGSAARYSSGGAYGGVSSWLFNGTSTISIGLTDAMHTSSGGVQVNEAYLVNAAGQVVGRSPILGGSSNYSSYSIWFYDGTTSQNISLVDANHIRASDGASKSVATFLTDSGQVVGYADRFWGNGTALNQGRSAWIYDGSATRNIGMTDSIHTRNDGYMYSSAQDVNEAGQVIGNAKRFSVNLEKGQTAWFYDGTTTRSLGLTGVISNGLGYAEDGAWYNSKAVALNEAGQVVGNTKQIAGISAIGQGAWLFDGAVVIEIGLRDSAYLNGYDGRSYANVLDLNEAGQAIGYSGRLGDPALGTTAWFFNGETTISLGGLSYGTVGEEYSQAKFLSESGIVLGTYRLFDTVGNYAESLFMYSENTGLNALNLLVDPELTDWDLLFNSISLSEDGSVLLSGESVNNYWKMGTCYGPNGVAFQCQVTAYTANSFVLNPSTAVPVPAAVWLFGSALGLLGWRCRKSSRSGTLH